MIHNRSAPPRAIVPVLIYQDVGKAVAWLCDAFGFTERLRAGDIHAQLNVGDGGAVMLGGQRTGQSGSADATDRAEFRRPRADEVTHYILVRVDDVDRHHERAKSRGAKIILPPTVYPYGEKQYTAEERQSHRWTFSQSVADVAPESWGGVVAKVEQ